MILYIDKESYDMGSSSQRISEAHMLDILHNNSDQNCKVEDGCGEFRNYDFEDFIIVCQIGQAVDFK